MTCDAQKSAFHDSPDPLDLPASYDTTSVILMPVAPHLAQTIWEIAADQLQQTQKLCGGEQMISHAVLRLHYSSDFFMQSSREQDFFEVVINWTDKKQYITLPEAGQFYQAELGIKSNDGRFLALARSNVAESPRDQPVAPPASATMSDAAPSELPEQRSELFYPAVNKMHSGAKTSQPPWQKNLSVSLKYRLLYAVEVLENSSSRSGSGSAAKERTPASEKMPAAMTTDQYGITSHSPVIDLTEYSEKKFKPGISSN